MFTIPDTFNVEILLDAPWNVCNAMQEVRVNVPVMLLDEQSIDVRLVSPVTFKPVNWLPLQKSVCNDVKPDTFSVPINDLLPILSAVIRLLVEALDQVTPVQSLGTDAPEVGAVVHAKLLLAIMLLITAMSPVL
jgi:hypothetical protein